MTKFLFAALTTLFVSFMPLSAAYSEGVPSAGDCTTFEMLYSPDEIAALKDINVKIIKLDTKQTAAFLKGLNEALNIEPPFAITNVIVFRKDDGEVAILIWFDGLCHQGTGRLPSQIVNPLLGNKS